MNKKNLFNKIVLSAIVLSSSLSFSACIPNSAIPTMFIASNPADPTNPSNPVDPSNPSNPSTELPNNGGNGGNGGGGVVPVPVPVNPDHPAPPDPQQPQTEDDFWKLMQRFGFMQTRTKADLLADIKTGVAMKITAWSPGTVKDINKNILAKYKDADTKKYMNPYPKTVEEYTQKSFLLAKNSAVNVDFYLDVEYGAKDGKGRINMQRVDPRTLEVLYYNKSGQITNYTQTRLPASGPPPLLRLTHFLFIPPKVYK
jgi:hypothetical protein